MNDLDRVRAEIDARRAARGPHRGTRYSDAVNRYLGAVNYRELNLMLSGASGSAAVMPAPAEHPIRGTTELVVVGVDESPASYTALDHAAIEAELRGCDLLVVHAQHALVNRYQSRDRGARLLERMAERVHGCSPTVPVTSRLVNGAPTASLLSESKDATLLVVGHRHGAVGGALGLSVGERVASHHRGPVLVVRVPGWPAGPDLTTRPIVVGVDDSPASLVAIEFALAEAGLRECDVVLLRAGDARMETRDRMARSGDTVIHHRVVPADPASALIAASGRAAAMVVGRHGHAGLPGRPLGSVSRALIEHAECPVFRIG